MAAAATAAAGGEKGKDEEKEEAMKKVEDHYYEEWRGGVRLDPQDLRAYCKDEGITPVPTLKEMSELRHKWKYIGMHSRWVKPPAYVGASVDKLGNLMVDVAEFSKNLRVVNKGCYILLVATDLLSQKLSVIPFSNKSQASWERGIAQFITRDFPCVQTIITDRWVCTTSVSAAIRA
jgi:hypothetical protein